MEDVSFEWDYDRIQYWHDPGDLNFAPGWGGCWDALRGVPVGMGGVCRKKCAVSLFFVKRGEIVFCCEIFVTKVRL